MITKTRFYNIYHSHTSSYSANEVNMLLYAALSQKRGIHHIGYAKLGTRWQGASTRRAFKYIITEHGTPFIV